MIFLQTDLNKGRVHSGVGGVDRRKVGSDADIGDDHVEIFRGDHAANLLLHSGDVIVGDFDARSGWSLDVDDKLARISARKKCPAQKRVDRETEGPAGKDRTQRTTDALNKR